MSIRVTANVDVAAASRQLRRFGDEAKRDLKNMNKDAADVVGNYAKVLVPKRSGKLAGSIRTSGTLAGGNVRAGRASVPYAGVIHYGWPSRPRRPWGTPGRTGGGPISPQPFLFDAADRRRRQVIDVYERRIAELARRYG